MVKGWLDILLEGGDGLPFLMVFTESFRSEIGFFISGFGCTSYCADRGCSKVGSMRSMLLKSIKLYLGVRMSDNIKYKTIKKIVLALS